MSDDHGGIYAAIITALVALGGWLFGRAGQGKVTTNRLNSVDGALRKGRERMGRHSERLDQHAERLASLEAHQADSERKLETIDSKLDRILDWIISRGTGSG